MSISEKIKAINIKIEHYQLYHQETLVSTNFYLAKILYPKKTC